MSSSLGSVVHELVAGIVASVQERRSSLGIVGHAGSHAGIPVRSVHAVHQRRQSRIVADPTSGRKGSLSCVGRTGVVEGLARLARNQGRTTVLMNVLHGVAPHSLHLAVGSRRRLRGAVDVGHRHVSHSRVARVGNLGSRILSSGSTPERGCSLLTSSRAPERRGSLASQSLESVHFRGPPSFHARRSRNVFLNKPTSTLALSTGVVLGRFPHVIRVAVPSASRLVLPCRLLLGRNINVRHGDSSPSSSSGYLLGLLLGRRLQLVMGRLALWQLFKGGRSHEIVFAGASRLLGQMRHGSPSSKRCSSTGLSFQKQVSIRDSSNLGRGTEMTLLSLLPGGVLKTYVQGVSRVDSSRSRCLSSVTKSLGLCDGLPLWWFWWLFGL